MLPPPEIGSRKVQNIRGVHPLHLQQNSDSAKCSTERSHMSKIGRGKLFLSVEVQNLHTILL